MGRRYKSRIAGTNTLEVEDSVKRRDICDAMLMNVDDMHLLALLITTLGRLRYRDLTFLRRIDAA